MGSRVALREGKGLTVSFLRKEDFKRREFFFFGGLDSGEDFMAPVNPVSERRNNHNSPRNQPRFDQSTNEWTLKDGRRK